MHTKIDWKKGDRMKKHGLVVLVVEDELVISNFLCAILTAEGYKVINADSGRTAISMAASHCPDLVLLDLGLPDMDGMDVLKEVRGWYDKPIIVVSARLYEDEKVQALDAGADDYVTKPFGNSELLARVRTAIRRSSANVSKTDTAGIFCVHDLCVDYDRRVIRLKGERIHVTPIEYRILVLLAQNAGRVLTYDYIIGQIWGPYTSDPQTLRVNMANIRRRIEDNPADPRYIFTEVSIGYRMTDGS